jgi:hypothetical protein
VCDVLGPLERAYRRLKHGVAVVWVDFQGSSAPARKVLRHNHLTFPVVVDPKGASIKTWRIQGYPYWLLLDSRGRVVEARFKPQTVAQLEQLLARAK